MSDANTDTFARGAAIVSLIVAIAAMMLPYIEQRRQFQTLQKEELTVHLNPHADGLLRVTDRNFGPMGRLVQVPFGLTLSNTGYQNLSITLYSVSAGDNPNSTTYTGIDGGIFQSVQHPLELPIKLDSGESRSLVLFIGILVPPSVFEILSSINDPSLLTASRARDILGKHGIDLYGNKVSYTEYEPGSFLFSVKAENQKSPTFWSELFTGRGNTFIGSGTTYEVPK